MKRALAENSFSIDGYDVVVSGTFAKSARLRDEYYVSLSNPEAFLQRLRHAHRRIDVFTFLEELAEPKPRHGFFHEKQSIAALPITTYDYWWTKQINDKTRNMVRKARKSGVELRIVEFDDALLKGIKEIYDESSLRQGKPFKHYGKDLDTIKNEHKTFMERSDFVGAFFKEELIGFSKLVEGKNVASLMQIISKFAHRNKAPTNALMAKAVEMCGERKVSLLHYGTWSRGGLGAFKTNHAFIRYEVPRYYLPLTFNGKLILKLKLHRGVADSLPEKWLLRAAHYRSRWNSSKFAQKRSKGAVAQLTEHRS